MKVTRLATENNNHPLDIGKTEQTVSEVFFLQYFVTLIRKIHL